MGWPLGNERFDLRREFEDHGTRTSRASLANLFDLAGLDSMFEIDSRVR